MCWSSVDALKGCIFSATLASPDCVTALIKSLSVFKCYHSLKNLLIPNTQLTTLELIGERGEVRRFRPGLDYTVAHHGVLAAKPCLDAVLCVLGADTPESHELWEAGEVGGYEAYLLADDDEEAPTKAEVYRANADGTGPEETGVINISPAHNCLSLVLRDEETDLLKFVKYVSASAPGSRWDVSMVRCFLCGWVGLSGGMGKSACEREKMCILTPVGCWRWYGRGAAVEWTPEILSNHLTNYSQPHHRHIHRSCAGV